MPDFHDGYLDNLWLKIARWNPLTGRYKAGSADISPTKFVADWPELQTIPKVAENNNVIAHVESFPYGKNLLQYKHASQTWFVISPQTGVQASSIMWVGSSDMQSVGGAQGYHPLATARRGYYNNTPTWTNIGQYIKGFRAATGCGTGTGTMYFNKTNKTLTWTAPGDTAGVPVNVSVGGWFRLESGSANKEALVCIKASLEPGVDKTDSPAIANNVGDVISFSSYIGAYNLRNGNPFGERQYFYTMGALDVTQFLASASQWEGVLSDITVLDLLSASSRASLSQVDTALATLLTIIGKRQALGSRVIVMAPSVYNAQSDAESNFSVYMRRKLRSLADANDFEVADPSLYIGDPAGSLSNPGLAACFNSSDLTYYNVLGAYKIDKYVLGPILNKYVAKRMPSDAEMIPYSVTEPFGNLFTNGRLTGVAGAANNGCTGTVPTSWSLGKSGASLAVVGSAPDDAGPARTDGRPGKYFRIACDNTAGADGDYATFSQTVNISGSNYAAGDVIQMSGEVRVSEVTGNGILIMYLYINGSNFSEYCFTSVSNNNGPFTYEGDAVTYNFETRPITIPAGVSSLNIYSQFQMKAGATAKIDIGQNLCMKKLIY